MEWAFPNGSTLKKVISLFALVLALGLVATASAGSASTNDQIADAPQHRLAASPDCSYEWELVSSVDPGDAINDLYGVDAAGPDDVWAVGYYFHYNEQANALIERWNGTQWTRVVAPHYDWDDYLYGVSAASPTDVWAVGDRQYGSLHQTLTMHWTGSSWSYLPGPNVGESQNNFLMSVAAISPAEAWAVGRYNDMAAFETRTLIVRWNGSSWSVVPSPNAEAQTNSLFAITAAGDDLWAVGYYNTADPYTGRDRTLTMRYHNGVWSIVPSPDLSPDDHNRLLGVAATGPNDVWAVGRAFVGSLESTLVEHWDGNQWSIVPSPNYPHAASSLSSVAVGGPNDVWAAGYWYNSSSPQETLVEHWNGSAWSVIASPSPGSGENYLNGVTVSATSPEDVWAVGYSYNESGSPDLTVIERYHPCVPTCTTSYTDVPQGSTFYPYVRCLGCRGIFGGYSDGTFRPSNNITRGQIAKVVSSAAGYSDDVTGRWTYADVPSSNTFWQWIERLAIHGVMGGYQCGGPNEPCDPQNRPYFRWASNATRAQLAKIVSNAAGFSEEPATETFADVPSSHPFFVWIERLAERSIMGGYQCGGVGEPCDPYSRPYFRPYNNITRGQAAKIVSNAFFPFCYTPARP